MKQKTQLFLEGESPTLTEFLTLPGSFSPYEHLP